MEKVKKLFHRDHDASDAQPGTTAPSTTPMNQVPPPQDMPAREPLQTSSVPQGQVYIPPAPHSNANQSTAQNAGMLGGAVVSHELGSGMGMGMVDGMVVGGMINQRINQQKKSNYWREQEALYQAGLPAAGVGDPRVVEAPSKHPSREEKRAARRQKRWDRRSKRQSDGGNDSRSSSGDSD